MRIEMKCENYHKRLNMFGIAKLKNSELSELLNYGVLEFDMMPPSPLSGPIWSQ